MADATTVDVEGEKVRLGVYAMGRHTTIDLSPQHALQLATSLIKQASKAAHA